jgi:hypothetical protein
VRLPGSEASRSENRFYSYRWDAEGSHGYRKAAKRPDRSILVGSHIPQLSCKRQKIRGAYNTIEDAARLMEGRPKRGGKGPRI